MWHRPRLVSLVQSERRDELSVLINVLWGQYSLLVESVKDWRPFPDTVPALSELKKRFKAAIVSIGNYYAGGYDTDFHLFAALGYDGVPDTGDEPNIVSMSFGNGEVVADGWDFQSRFIASLNRRLAPQTTWLKSSGNGAPGYSTVNTPSPPGSISVGACTVYDTCDVFDSIQGLDQILSGEIQNWSDPGPQGTGALGVHVVAHGAWGSGDVPLNESKDGWTAWEQWGGTSRSCPEAAGVVAILYQAYRQAHGQWPSFETAKRLLMNAATDLGHDVHRQGAGRVHAGRAAALASRTMGVEVVPPLWEPGDFRGQEYSAYTKIVHPGDVWVKDFEIANVGGTPVSLDISDVRLEEFAHTEFTVATVASASEERLFRKPDYIHLFHGPGADTIPPETDLIVFEAIYPFETFDTDYVPGHPETVRPPRENVYRLLVYDWKDVNGNGKLYDDSLGAVPGMVETGEIDQGEFMRFNYGYLDGTTQKVFVSNPLSKIHDGMWVGFRHRIGPPEGFAITIRVRARFFHEVDCPWLQTGLSSLTIPAAATEALRATVNVPQGLSPGFYSSKLVLTPTGGTGSGEPMAIPITLNVAADFSTGSFSISGATEGSEPYGNHTVHGDFSWDGRSEAGDGRFFFFDVQDPPPGSYAVAKTTWQDDPPTDIDTLILGPVSDVFTDPSSANYHPDFGPNRLEQIGGFRSPAPRFWRFQTASGGPLDYSVAPLEDGLHALFLHNVSFSGNRFGVPFTVEAGSIRLEPHPLKVMSASSFVQSQITLTSGVALQDVTATVYGPSKVNRWYVNHPIDQGHSWWWQLPIKDCGLFEVELTGTAADLDLYLYRDGADGSEPDEEFTGAEQVAGSFSWYSNEKVTLAFPPDGFYRALAYGEAVHAPTDTFTLIGRVILGRNAEINPQVLGNLAPNAPTALQVEASLGDGQVGEYDLFLNLGIGGVDKAIGLRVPLVYYIPGDADFNGVVEGYDLLEASRHWNSDIDVPAGIDYNRDDRFLAGDLLELIKTLTE